MKKLIIILLLLLIFPPVCLAVPGAIRTVIAMKNAGADVRAPTWVSTTVDTTGDVVTVVFSENLTNTALGGGEFDLDCDGASGADNVLVYASGDGTGTWVFAPTATVQAGEACTTGFDGAANEAEDDALNDLADYGPVAVTNNSAIGVTFLFAETFDGAAEDETWSLATSWDDDNTTTPINGAQDLLGPMGAGTTELNIGTLGTDSQTTTYSITKLRVVNGGGNVFSFGIRDVDDTCVAIVNLTMGASTATTVTRLTLYFDDSCGDSVYTSFTETPIDCAAECVVKLKYIKGTGANGVVQAWFTTRADYDVNGWANAKTKSVADSTNQEDVDYVYIRTSSTDDIVQADDVRLNTTDNVDY